MLLFTFCCSTLSLTTLLLLLARSACLDLTLAMVAVLLAESSMYLKAGESGWSSGWEGAPWLLGSDLRLRSHG